LNFILDIKLTPKIFLILLTCIGLFNCKEKSQTNPEANNSFIRSCDLSFLPQVRLSSINCKNAQGLSEDMLTTLKNAGMNTVRLRIWNQPLDGHSGFEEVKKLSKEIKNLGLKVWLTVHYSDTWADPGAQTKPQNWKQSTYGQLKDSVYAYTQKIMQEIDPDLIQIGNEINNGLLWPEGSYNNLYQMAGLISSGIKAVRDHSNKTKIVLHYAGHQHALPFFLSLPFFDYDIIGLSYYPFWHGKNLDSLSLNIIQLGNEIQKDVLIAETSYPFSFGWNDYTNNVIGSTDQILANYPASPQGQKNYLMQIKKIMSTAPRGIGYSYWGGEWISFKGNTAKDGSSYENQAMWDFNSQSLPVIESYKQ